MKFLTFPRLNRVCLPLRGLDLGDHILVARAETYSCKRSRDDKRLASAVTARLNRIIASKLAAGESTHSPLGDLTTPSTQKLLVSLITTLNAAFPDYDFSSLPAEAFGRAADVTQARAPLDANVLRPAEGALEGVRAEFWASAEEAIGPLDTTTAYVYLPDPDSPLLGTKLWSAVYFFYSPRLRRVLLVATWAKSKLHSPALAAARATGDAAAAGDGDDDDDDDAAGAGGRGAGAGDGEGGARRGSMGEGNGGEMGDGRDGGAEDDDDESDGYLYDDDDDDDATGLPGSSPSGPGSRHHSTAGGPTAPTAVVNVSMLDWDELGVSEIFLPDTAWVSPALGPAPHPSGASGASSTVAAGGGGGVHVSVGDVVGAGAGGVLSRTVSSGGSSMTGNHLPGLLPPSVLEQQRVPGSGTLTAGQQPGSLSPLLLPTRGPGARARSSNGGSSAESFALDGDAARR